VRRLNDLNVTIVGKGDGERTEMFI
jgi:hypothetical protein